jgi:3-dehydroquinate synthetase
VKIGVIENDPFEAGVRAKLNLGHTIGHALELVTCYRLRHGEAVAIGLVVEARIAERLGIAEPGMANALVEVLEGLGLSTEIPKGVDPDGLLHAMAVDKKRAAGALRFTLPVRVGEVQVGIEVDESDIFIQGEPL